MISDENQTIEMKANVHINFVERYTLLLAHTLQSQGPQVECTVANSQLLARAALVASPDLAETLSEESLGGIFRAILENKTKTKLDASIQLINVPRLFGRTESVSGQKRTFGMANEEDVSLVDGQHAPTSSSSAEDVIAVTPSTKHSRLLPPTSSSSTAGAGAGAGASGGTSGAGTGAVGEIGHDDRGDDRGQGLGQGLGQEQGQGQGQGHRKGEEKQARKRGRPKKKTVPVATSSSSSGDGGKGEGSQGAVHREDDEDGDHDDDSKESVSETISKVLMSKDALVPSHLPRGMVIMQPNP